VTIPKPLRQRLGIEPGHVLEFAEVDGTLVATRVVERPVETEYDLTHVDKSADELLHELQRLRR
jgi:bifunctional DNA-binding transcriptional regulator/antitoxin component of YhaV-PrlF toxin-antitoxin module